jgi:hypothetical protein
VVAQGADSDRFRQNRIPLIRVLLCLVLLVCGGTLPAKADKSQIGTNQYVVGIPSDQFVTYAAPDSTGRQRSPNWCWAACIQMVLNYHGLKVTQEEIVSRVFGSAIDHPAGPEQIMSALHGWAPDSRGRYSSIVADSRNLTQQSVLEDLQYRWPLVVGLSGKGGQTGHAYVLTAAFYSLDNSGNPQIYKVVLRNPWPHSPSKEEMSMQEFGQRCTFSTRIRVKRL